jgi:hypothetical protein
VIRPLPPIHERMWPHRAAISRKKPGTTRDASGGRVDAWGEPEPAIPCNVLGASVETVPDLAVRGTAITTVAVFPRDCGLDEGDTLAVTDEDGNPWGKTLTVVRYQRLGLWALARWQADCKAT